MDCIVTAGGIPGPEDPLYAYTQGKSKALLDMHGRTMLERVIDALQTSHYVERIVVVGLGDDMGMHFQRPVEHLPDQGGIVPNLLAGMHYLYGPTPARVPVLICSADIPAISGANVEAFVETCVPFDKGVYYNFVTQETMEARFPHSNRTFVKLKGVRIAGGDMVIAHADLADAHRELWLALTNARKHAWQLARIVGLGTLLKLLFRQLSLSDLEKTAERIIQRPTAIILSPFAELAMDADKPHQVDLLRDDLRARLAAPG
jgi:GTP:adenosylcobinamide-phosphate guanylyltransferase